MRDKTEINTTRFDERTPEVESVVLVAFVLVGIDAIIYRFQLA